MFITTLLQMPIDMIQIIEATPIPRVDIAGGKVWKNFQQSAKDTMKSTRDAEGSKSDYLDMNEECAIGDIMNRRHFARMKAEEISALFDMKEILVAIETDKKTFIGSIVNISAGGVSVKISSLVPIDLPLCISFNLGKKNIIVRARAKYICKIGDNYITGVIFTNIDKNSLQYIDGIICINALLKDIGAIQHKTISFCCTSQHPYLREQLNGHGTQSNAW